MSSWYPGANVWEDHGIYLVKHKFNNNGECTDIMYARGGLTNRQADEDHIHIWRVGTDQQGNQFRDASGKYQYLSDDDIQRIINGHQPLI